ncbi:MAG: TIGR04086 family membrane protein [Oscillospiraceae bacterium]
MNTNAEKPRRGKSEAESFVLGPAVGAAATLLILLLCAYLLYGNYVPASLMEEYVLISVFLGAAAAGVVVGRRRGRGVLTGGLAAGLLLFALIVLATWLSPEGVVLSQACLKLAICCVGGGLFGGALCLNRKRVKSHKRKA